MHTSLPLFCPLEFLLVNLLAGVLELKSILHKNFFAMQCCGGQSKHSFTAGSFGVKHEFTSYLIKAVVSHLQHTESPLDHNTCMGVSRIIVDLLFGDSVAGRG